MAIIATCPWLEWYPWQRHNWMRLRILISLRWRCSSMKWINKLMIKLIPSICRSINSLNNRFISRRNVHHRWFWCTMKLKLRQNNPLSSRRNTLLLLRLKGTSLVEILYPKLLQLWRATLFLCIHCQIWLKTTTFLHMIATKTRLYTENVLIQQSYNLSQINATFPSRSQIKQLRKLQKVKLRWKRAVTN